MFTLYSILLFIDIQQSNVGAMVFFFWNYFDFCLFVISGSSTGTFEHFPKEAIQYHDVCSLL